MFFSWITFQYGVVPLPSRQLSVTQLRNPLCPLSRLCCEWYRKGSAGTRTSCIWSSGQSQMTGRWKSTRAWHREGWVEAVGWSEAQTEVPLCVHWWCCSGEGEQHHVRPYFLRTSSIDWEEQESRRPSCTPSTEAPDQPCHSVVRRPGVVFFLTWRTVWTSLPPSTNCVWL